MKNILARFRLIGAVMAMAAAAAPSIGWAMQPASVQLNCTAGTSGTCTVSAQGGGVANGTATTFNWEGTNVTITPTSPNTATFACNSAGNVTTGYIAAYTGIDGTGKRPLGASVYVQCQSVGV